MIQEAIQLPDGRMLYYNLFGPQEGRPVLYFHGTPSSRLEPLLPTIYGVDINALLQQCQIQLIAIDRPGMGFSTLNPEGSFLAFADDAATLLRHKNISQCPILTWSGGGPFALAMAHQYPELVSSLFIIAGFTISLNTPGLFDAMTRSKYYFGAAKNTPFLVETILDCVTKMEINKSFSQFITGTPDVDYEYLKQVRPLRQLAAITVQEACRYGSAGAVQEAAGYFNEFGFELTSINQPIHYWWGTEDHEIISWHPEAIKQMLPHTKLYIKNGEGHLSIYIKYIEEVLNTITSGKNEISRY